MSAGSKCGAFCLSHKSQSSGILFVRRGTPALCRAPQVRLTRLDNRCRRGEVVAL